MDIETVDQVDLESTVPEKTGHIEEAERFGPEVIGRKVINPGVDQKNPPLPFHGAIIPQAGVQEGSGFDSVP